MGVLGGCAQALFPNCVLDFHTRSLYTESLRNANKSVRQKADVHRLIDIILLYDPTTGRRMSGWGRSASIDILTAATRDCFTCALQFVFAGCDPHVHLLRNAWPTEFVETALSRFSHKSDDDEARAWAAFMSIEVAFEQDMLERLPELRRMLVDVPSEISSQRLEHIKDLCIERLDKVNDHIQQFNALVSIMAQMYNTSHWKFDKSQFLDGDAATKVADVLSIMEDHHLTRVSKAALAMMCNK